MVTKIVKIFYTVKPGDNLLRIAKSRNIGFAALANTNNIRSPYRIFPGQKILIAPLHKSHRHPVKRTKSATQIQVFRMKPVHKKAPYPVAKVHHPTRIKWQWPIRGAIKKVQTSSELSKGGIDIFGELGQPVVVASSGRVVYAGRGLLGYGRLIIVKHSAAFLSAYAHNKELLVGEGQEVKAGQTIALMGLNAKGRAVLHFEIRYKGKTVNPNSYLPAQS